MVIFFCFVSRDKPGNTVRARPANLAADQNSGFALSCALAEPEVIFSIPICVKLLFRCNCTEEGRSFSRNTFAKFRIVAIYVKIITGWIMHRTLTFCS